MNKLLPILPTPDTKSDWRFGLIHGKKRVKGNNWSAFHLSLGKGKVMTTDALSLESQSALLTL